MQWCPLTICCCCCCFFCVRCCTGGLSTHISSLGRTSHGRHICAGTPVTSCVPTNASAAAGTQGSHHRHYQWIRRFPADTEGQDGDVTASIRERKPRMTSTTSTTSTTQCCHLLGDDEMAACGQLGNVGLAFRPSPILEAPERFRRFLLPAAAGSPTASSKTPAA
ncbi:hypothetical protein Vafri_18912 [Volvox africanus]|uniref:Secreted protein n=1 Tax=Volvox africanus TaxID=51714 RepID=A0A8J4BTE7_9CHLO|nr:hypothetical protein Vafri_18912 [Volvox africanus]